MSALPKEELPAELARKDMACVAYLQSLHLHHLQMLFQHLPDQIGLCGEHVFQVINKLTRMSEHLSISELFNCGTFSGNCFKQSRCVHSFNFPTSSSTVASTVTHLSNQCYTICFRQEQGKCAICYSTVIMGTAAAIDQGSFGLSKSSLNSAAKGRQDTGCDTDYLQFNPNIWLYIQIPGAQRDAEPAAEMFVVGSIAAFVHSRICGRFFSFTDAATIDGGVDNTESICTQQRPFRVIFKTDGDEDAIGISSATANEQGQLPGGIIGFHLNFALQDC
eukprot:TCALIF_13319-PA protein Name:"Protein of unknown function" AED:0.29 eAED:0.29 QI:0/0.16/0/0.42/1/1/7/0/276